MFAIFIGQTRRSSKGSGGADSRGRVPSEERKEPVGREKSPLPVIKSRGSATKSLQEENISLHKVCTFKLIAWEGISAQWLSTRLVTERSWVLI